MEKEIWKDIKGFEGRFQVSNLGRIKRLEYVYTYLQTNQFDKTGKEVRQTFPEKIYKKRRTKGRNTVAIDGKEYFVYRLVVSNFIRPILPKEEVNHINGDKQDDRLSNLEIVSRIENHNHACNLGLNKVAGKAIRVKIDGKIFESLGEASRYYNVDKKVILGKLKNSNYRPYKNGKTIPYKVERV